MEIDPRPITLVADIVSKISGETRQIYISPEYEQLMQSNSLRIPAGQSAGALQVDVSLNASYMSVSLLEGYEQADSGEMFCLSAVIQTGLACGAAVNDPPRLSKHPNYLVDATY